MSSLVSSAEDHEAFKSRLVNDVFGKNQDKVEMEKVMMLLWQFRDDPTVVQFMAQFVAKYAGTRDVFKGVEFYLPQLAHMIIHLEVDWDDAILERFALIIAQQSLHFALQLNWILQGNIEDYQPELPSGETNPDYNPLFYSRCVKLLTNIERCVVYGRPRSMELQRLYEKGKITKKEYDILEHADRRFNAFQIVGEDNVELKSFGGELYYKRRVRRSKFRLKGWKTRYFSIEERMLNCYNKKGGALVRSMPLEGAVVQNKPDDKYPHMFSVKNQKFEFIMRATTQEEKERWMKELEEESRAHALFVSPDGGAAKEADSGHLRLVEDLTPSQRARFEFFKDERDFVRDMCDIAEELRFVERPERKKVAPGLLEKLGIPPCVYVPLCNSTDIWRRVEKSVWKEVKVFNTKERCPVIMYFLSRRGERMRHHRGGMKDVNLDVAEYLHLQYDIRDDSGESGTMELIEEGDEDSGMGSPQESTGDLKAKGEEGEKTKEEVEGGEKEEEGDDDKNGDDLRDSGSFIATIWHESDHAARSDTPRPSRDSGGGKGNRLVQSFMRDNVVSLPRKLATRLESVRRFSVAEPRKSMVDKLPMQSVPILETLGEEPEEDESLDQISVVSIERGSVYAGSGGGILLGDMHPGGIDVASIERATQTISHGESWVAKTARMLRENADEEDVEGVAEIASLMAKSNDDLRQEVFVMQMIHFYKSVFAKAKLPLWIKTYSILSTSKDTGLIEVLTDATSIDGLKKSEGFPAEGGLRAYFEQTYGGPDSESFKEAQKNFMRSLAGYSLVSYLLGLKDRHNGNIMIDTRGHLIFIDFGFAMGMAPGHEFSFERAPFKLTKEYVEVMGGENSACYAEFQELFAAGFQEARNNSQIALGLVEIMMYKSNYPCFSGFRYGHGSAVKRFEKRLMLRTPDYKVEKKALGLVRRSNNNFGTWLYDAFQHWSNGYAM